jgi:hypothetical protein
MSKSSRPLFPYSLSAKGTAPPKLLRERLPLSATPPHINLSSVMGRSRTRLPVA